MYAIFVMGRRRDVRRLTKMADRKTVVLSKLTERCTAMTKRERLPFCQCSTVPSTTGFVKETDAGSSPELLP